MDWVVLPLDWALSCVDVCDLLGDLDLSITPVLFYCHGLDICKLARELNFEPTRPSGD